MNVRLKVKATPAPSFIFIILALAMSSCWTEKSVEDAALFSTPEGPSLLVQESHYHITSYSREGGVTTKSGYTYFYLNSLDPKSGKSIGQVRTSKSYKEKPHFIGIIDQKAWFASPKEDLGLHARDLQSLEVVLKASDILEKNPDWGDAFILEGGNSNQFYGYLPDSAKIFVTGSSGQFYLFDPKNLALENLEEKPREIPIGKAYLDNQLYFGDSLTFNFRGDLRKEIYLNRDKEPVPGISYLNPKFLIDPLSRRKPRPIWHSERNMIFVLSESKIGTSKGLILSGISLSSPLKELWSIPLGVEESDDFQRGYCQKIELLDNRLLLAYAKKIYCLDVTQGKIIWEKVYE